MRRWEDAYLDGLCGLGLLAALVLLIWSIAGCAGKVTSTSSAAAASSATSRRQVDEASITATGTTSAQTGIERTRRTITRKPDGTIIDERLAERLIQLRSGVWVARKDERKAVDFSNVRASSSSTASSSKPRSRWWALLDWWWLAPIVIAALAIRRWLWKRWPW